MEKTLTLSNGEAIPQLGLGTWAAKPGEVETAIKYAIKEAGYRHIDCAFAYQNEAEIGKALKELFDEGVVKREELFITSKVWNAFHSRAKVVECCKLSLQKLGLDYLDLYLIHWPVALIENGELFPKNEAGEMIMDESIDYLQTWEGMEDCYNAGLVKSIGLSNFNSQQITRVLSNYKVKPVMLQVECHPYLNQEKLKEFCALHGIKLTGFSPLGSPNRFFATKEEPLLLEEPKILELAKKYNKSPAQILIRFNIQRGIVCIPKSATPERILANTNVFDFEMTSEEISDLFTLKQYRYVCPDWYRKSKFFPFVIEY